jgi:hypothetical protein
MGRDIRVESKHLVYRGSKSSDLIMAFDRFFAFFPRCDMDDGIYFEVRLSRKEMGQALDFIKADVTANSKLYRNADVLLEQMNNIYIRMMPGDFVEVNVW